jgi:outer membrane protein OmpA-like peptidoglycan-associated protein
MRVLLYIAAACVAGCASVTTAEAPPSPIDPTVYHDFRVVPRAPDVALYPAVAEHVWVPVPADRVLVSVKVTNYPPPAKPVVAITPPAAQVAAQQTARPTPAPARAPQVYTAEVHFAFDRHSLDSTAKQAIEQLLQRVGTSLGSAEIVIEGYTDSVGSDSYNARLSTRRASSVRDYLVSKGASPSLVAVSGKGETSPVDTNKTAEGRAHNRRSTVQITSD